jgi:hypothetical protein
VLPLHILQTFIRSWLQSFITLLHVYTIKSLHDVFTYSHFEICPLTHSLLRSADCLPDNPSEQTPRKTVAPLLSCVSNILATVIALLLAVAWRRTIGSTPLTVVIRGNVFIEPLPRSGFHNTGVLLMRDLATGCLPSISLPSKEQ